MKKLIAISAIALVSASAHASYLYWQVGGDDNFTAISSVDPSNLTYARFVLKDSRSNALYDYAQLDNSEGPSSYSMPSAKSIDISSLESGTGAFSYYIELGTYNNSTWSGYAISQTYTASTYAEIASQAIAASSALSYSDLVAAKVTPFHGGSYSVPEPTSAILMMFGMAFLGLKRKNRSIV